MFTGRDEFETLHSPALPLPPSLKDLPQASLFLDFDGTLVDIAPEPDAIRVAPELPAVLTALSARLDGRFAVVSGRSLENLGSHLDSGGIAVAGSHGGELRLPGDAAAAPLAGAPISPGAEAELRRFAETRTGLLVEPKPFSVALHYRQNPDAQDDVLAFAELLASAMGLRTKRGKMVVELLMPGFDKGSVVEKFMAMPAFRGSRPIFLGDDITDEDAFIKVLEYNGGGILVGHERKTAARWRLPDIGAVHDWLKAALE